MACPNPLFLIRTVSLCPNFGGISMMLWAQSFLLMLFFQSKRTIETLVDMLYACVLPWNGSWEDHLALVEFAYNNSYPASIKMATYEVLYEGVFLHCVGKYLVSDCWLVHIRYNRLMVRYIRSDRIC
jgi:hypothetical protein